MKYNLNVNDMNVRLLEKGHPLNLTTTGTKTDCTKTMHETQIHTNQPHGKIITNHHEILFWKMGQANLCKLKGIPQTPWMLLG